MHPLSCHVSDPEPSHPRWVQDEAQDEGHGDFAHTVPTEIRPDSLASLPKGLHFGSSRMLSCLDFQGRMWQHGMRALEYYGTGHCSVPGSHPSGLSFAFAHTRQDEEMYPDAQTPMSYRAVCGDCVKLADISRT